jgi:AAA+ ATPase superfamily predicted ATPase
MTLERPARILDRSAEWSALASVWQSDRPELVLVSGRRRIGKSYLLAPLAAQTGGLYYQATRRTESEQLAAFSRLLGARFDDPALREGVQFPRWDAALRYVLDRTRGSPFLLIFDEFPYLEEASPGLASVIQSLWDHEVSESRLKIVLAGSHVAWMATLEGADQPLHARFTRRMLLKPFDYRDSARFYPAYDARDRLRTYGAFGGVAGRLAVVDSTRSFAANVRDNMLDPTMRLFDEAGRILDPFLDETQVHYSIIQAIAGGAHTWGEITKVLGRSAGSLSRPLRWLLEMGYVWRDVPVTEPDRAQSRRALYRLDDPYLSFWHRYIGPLASTGASVVLSGAESWKRNIAPTIEGYMGGVFEDACRAFLSTAPSALPFRPLRVGSWWAADGSDQVDAVAVGDGDLLVGECKWGRVGVRELGGLNDRVARLSRELGGGLRIHRALFSAAATYDARLTALAANGELLLFGADDLYADDAPA